MMFFHLILYICVPVSHVQMFGVHDNTTVRAKLSVRTVCSVVARSTHRFTQ